VNPRARAGLKPKSRYACSAAALFGVAVLLTSTHEARAFCRKATKAATGDSADNNSDPSVKGACDDAIDAYPTYWADDCIAYSVEVTPDMLELGFTQNELVELTDRAAALWTAVKCGKKNSKVRLKLVNASRGSCPTNKEPQITCCLEVSRGKCTKYDQVTKGTAQVRFASGKVGSSEGSQLGVAVTCPSFPHPDARYEVSTSKETALVAEPARSLFGTVRINDVTQGNMLSNEAWRLRLLYTVTHEFGHLIGLRHSEKKGAIMTNGYEPTRGPPIVPDAQATSDWANQVALTDDDIAGACDIFSSDAPLNAGCSVGETTMVSASFPVLFGFLLVARLRRRRSTWEQQVSLAST
jgi:Matrixin